MDKKAVSEVVAVVVLILLTITAGLIVAGIVIPFVRNNLSRGSECLPYRNYLTFDEGLGGNCYSGDIYSLDIKRKNFDSSILNNSGDLDKGIKGMQIVLSSASRDSKSFGPSEIIRADGSAGSLPKAGGIARYNVTTTGNYNKAELYVVLNSGRVCEDSKDTITITRC